MSFIPFIISLVAGYGLYSIGYAKGYEDAMEELKKALVKSRNDTSN